MKDEYGNMIDTKKKIYTLTCTWAPSYGAVLQAYALARSIQGLGYDTQVINYQPSWSRSGNKIKAAITLLKSRMFDGQYLRFLRTQDIITPEKYATGESIFAAELDARAFIVGSDQVWNSTKYYNGKDDAMFLSFAKPGQKRVSYAASLAMSEVPSGQVERYKTLLDKFDAVSVRENTGAAALNAIGVEDVATVIDPVYLVSQGEWSSLAGKSRLPMKTDKYIVIVCLESRDDLYEYARRKADKMGAKLYSFKGGLNGWRRHGRVDRNFWNISIYDYLNVMKNAQAVVTDSFHAMSFSLIFNIDVDIIPRSDNGNSRMVDLLSDLGLSARLTSSDKMLAGGIDYSDVNIKISEKVSDALTFLSDSLGNEALRATKKGKYEKNN